MIPQGGGIQVTQDTEAKMMFMLLGGRSLCNSLLTGARNQSAILQRNEAVPASPLANTNAPVTDKRAGTVQ